MIRSSEAAIGISGSAAAPVRRIGLAASFTAAAIEPYLSYWMRRLRWAFELQLAPYGQVLEPLCGCRSALRDSREDTHYVGGREESVRAAAVLIRPQDLLRDDGVLRADQTAIARGREHVEAIAHAVRGGDRSRGALLVGAVAASPDAARDRAIARFDRWARARIAHAVEGAALAYWLDFDRAIEIYEVGDVHDPFREDLAHIPFTEEYLAAIATVVVRALRALWEPPRKAIVLDCDNTLWRGACGEEPVEALDPSGPYRALREFMCEQARAGRILCLASRNREVDVRRAFARCAAPLRWEQIAAHRISFGRKSRSLRALAAELGIASEEMVFIDDDPVECAEVRAAVPGVAVVQLPRERDRIPWTLAQVWELDALVVTEEDRLRGASYAIEARRREQRERAPSVDAFIAGLEVSVELRRLDNHTVSRAAQVLARTNQFNLTGARCSAAQLLQLDADADTEVVVARVRDRFGDYGLVGVFALTSTAPRATLSLLALSCRVLHRGVERRILQGVGQRARAAGCAELAIAFRRTERNGVAREFLEGLVHPGGGVRAADGSFHYSIPVADLAAGRGDGRVATEVA